MPKEDTVTFKDLYTLVDQKMAQFEKNMGTVLVRLETKLDSLETGRIVALENKVANQEGRNMAASFLIPTAISAFSILITLFLKK